MANEAGACQTRNVGSYEDEEEDEKQAAPLDEVRGRRRVTARPAGLIDRMVD